MEIKTYKYEKKEFNKIRSMSFGSDWPVVYIIEDKKEAYVGETVNVYVRSQQHYKRDIRRKLKEIHIIGDEQFNKSATLDIESLLIQYLSADGKYKLQNGNAGLKNHDYYHRSLYHGEKFKRIWQELKKRDLVEHDLTEIENSDLFKYSPYKALSANQKEVAKKITRQLFTGKTKIQIVHGEPGSGKTILAVYLVKYLVQIFKKQDKSLAIVVPMTSLRKTIKEIFKNIKDLKANMVIGPSDVAKKKYDLLIVDEAHRLKRRKSIVSYKSFDAANKKLGFEKERGTELDWILKQSDNTILFYDEAQSVRPSDIGHQRFIGSHIQDYYLNNQMRIQSEEDYVGYIDQLLNQEIKKPKWFKVYDFKLFEDLGEMVGQIRALDKELGLCRVLAGYAWKWDSKKNIKPYDIEIGDQRLKWNSKTNDWVNSSNAVNEVGCIHSIQGYDLNYAGVILGPEITLYNGKIIIDKAKYKDANGKKGVASDAQLKKYIINIYRVLLTRGIKGTYIYICDQKLRQYMRQYIQAFNYPGQNINIKPLAAESRQAYNVERT